MNQQQQYYLGRGPYAGVGGPWWEFYRGPTITTALHNDGCERCCETCLPLSASSNSRNTTETRDGSGPTTTSRPRHAICSCCLGLLFSLIVFFVLLSLSSVKDTTWALNTGESTHKCAIFESQPGVYHRRWYGFPLRHAQVSNLDGTDSNSARHADSGTCTR